MDKMDIKVLGAGCSNCSKLERMVIDVLTGLNKKTNVAHVKDFLRNCILWSNANTSSGY